MLPTIFDLLKKMGNRRNYPHVFPRIENAIIFFCAAFYGEQDAIYFYDYNLKDVTLVDTDAEKMRWMVHIYPKEWKFITGDAFSYAGRLLREGKTFDVVSADPFTNLIPRILIDDFDKFYGITRRYFVARVSYGSFLEKYKIEPTEAALAAFLTEKHNREIKVRELNQVSTFDGGCYWAVIEK